VPTGQWENGDDIGDFGDIGDRKRFRRNDLNGQSDSIQRCYATWKGGFATFDKRSKSFTLIEGFVVTNKILDALKTLIFCIATVTIPFTTAQQVPKDWRDMPRNSVCPLLP